MYKIFLYVLLYIVTFLIIWSTSVLTPEQDNNFPIIRLIIIFFASMLLVKYFLYMLISPWNDVVVAYKNKKNACYARLYRPMVSVLIPAWNEETGIIETIKTILKSTYKNLEIIVVNDGSTDNSDKLIRSFIRSYNARCRKQKIKNKINIVYQYKENGGKGTALNTAIKLSKGEILLSIDADCVVMKDTIKNFVNYFVDPNVMAAVGNVKIGNTQKIVGVIQYLEFLFSFYFKKADSVVNTIYIIGGAAGAFRREVFEKVGFYSTTNITEDIELSVRIQQAGMKIVYASDAIVYTEGASRLGDLMKQRLRWKRGRFETLLTHRDLFFSLDKKHNKLLSWIILPFAYFGELQLSLEPLFLLFLYVYSFLVNDFSSFISGIVVVASMFFIQIFFDDKKDKSIAFYLLAPIGWLLFYIATFVEFNALFKSAWGLWRKHELKWQKWQRVGVHG